MHTRYRILRRRQSGARSALATPAAAVDISRMADKTLFEKIRDREIPADIVHEDDDCLAFRDISPKAPVHILVVPKRVIARVGLAQSDDQALLGHLLLAAAEVARNQGIAESGYRIVINHGPHGGETVPHLHVHILGGRALSWPPG
jgi:histidine triad (HIT) family protein